MLEATKKTFDVVIRRVGGLEDFIERLRVSKHVIRRVGGLEDIRGHGKIAHDVIRRVGGLEVAHRGRSMLTEVIRRVGGSSPRTWGCFIRYSHGCGCPAVFPTHVGVFL